MIKPRTSLFITAMIVATLTACSDTRGDDNDPSAACLDSVQAVNEVVSDQVAYEEKLTLSLDACSDVDEWIRAVKKYPRVAVAQSAEFVDESFADVACLAMPERDGSAVCRDRSGAE